MNKLTGTLVYDYEIFPVGTSESEYVRGEKEFLDDLGFMLQQHIETQDAEIAQEIGCEIYCSEGKADNGKPIVNIEISDLEECRKVLAEEADEELENVTDEDVLEFVGEVITDVDTPDLNIVICQKEVGKEDVENYFIFKSDENSDTPEIDTGYISIKLADKSVISAEK